MDGMELIPPFEVARIIVRNAAFSLVDDAFMEAAVASFDEAIKPVIVGQGIVDEARYPALRAKFLDKGFVDQSRVWVERNFGSLACSDDDLLLFLNRVTFDFMKFQYDKSIDLLSMFKAAIEIGELD